MCNIYIYQNNIHMYIYLYAYTHQLCIHNEQRRFWLTKSRSDPKHTGYSWFWKMITKSNLRNKGTNQNDMNLSLPPNLGNKSVLDIYIDSMPQKMPMYMPMYMPRYLPLYLCIAYAHVCMAMRMAMLMPIASDTCWPLKCLKLKFSTSARRYMWLTHNFWRMALSSCLAASPVSQVPPPLRKKNKDSECVTIEFMKICGLIHVCEMTHSYFGQDWWLWVQGTHSNVLHDSFIHLRCF